MADFNFEDQEYIRDANIEEKKILSKFKKHISNITTLENKLTPILKNYQREQTLLESKYMKLVYLIKANLMEENVKADATMDLFWKRFLEFYEGEDDYLEVDIEAMKVYRVIMGEDSGSRGTYGIRDSDKETYMDDNWLKKLLGDMNDKDDEHPR